MRSAVLRSALATWRRQPVRTLAFLSVLGLTMALYALAAASADSLRAWYEAERVRNGQWPALKVDLQNRKRDAAGLPPSWSLESVLAPTVDWRGVERVVAIASRELTLRSPDLKSSIPVSALALPNSPLSVAQSVLASCWGSASLAARLAGRGVRLSLGDDRECAWQGALPLGYLPPDPVQAPQLFFHRLDFFRLFGATSATRAYVVMDEEGRVELLKPALEQRLRDVGLGRSNWQATVAATPWLALNDALSRSFLASNELVIRVGQFVGIALAVLVFQAGALRLRLPELGLRRSFGARRRDLFEMLLAEAAVMSVLATVLSNILALLGLGVWRALSSEPLALPSATLVSNSLVLMVVMWLLCLWPAHKALQIPPYVALKA